MKQDIAKTMGVIIVGPHLPPNRNRERRMLAILRAWNGGWVTSGYLADCRILSASQAYQRLREFGFPVESTGKGPMARYRLKAKGDGAE